MTWLYLAILAAVVWGIEYTFVEKVVGEAPAFTTYVWLHGIEAILAAFIATFVLGQSVHPRPLYEHDNGLAFGLAVVTGLIAGLALTGAIKQSGNATVTSLVEISYPFFVAIFSWLFLGHNRFSWETVVGGAMVFGGIYFVTRGQPTG